MKKLISLRSFFTPKTIAAVLGVLLIGVFGIMKMTGNNSDDVWSIQTAWSDPDIKINVPPDELNPKGEHPAAEVKNLAGKWELTYIYENCNGSEYHRFVQGELRNTQTGKSIHEKGKKSENLKGEFKKYTEAKFPAFIRGEISCSTKNLKYN